MGTFAISLKDNGEYKYTYNNKRGKTLVTSIAYQTKEDCYTNIDLLKNEIGNLSFSKYKTTAGKFYFKISLNETVFCISRKFTTILRIEKAILDIQKYILESEILDFTHYSFPEINFEDEED